MSSSQSQWIESPRGTFSGTAATVASGYMSACRELKKSSSSRDSCFGGSLGRTRRCVLPRRLRNFNDFKIAQRRVYRSRRPQNEWPTSCSRLVKKRICQSRRPQCLAAGRAEAEPEPSRAQPSRAEPRRVGPSRAGPSRAEPSRTSFTHPIARLLAAHYWYMYCSIISVQIDIAVQCFTNHYFTTLNGVHNC